MTKETDYEQKSHFQGVLASLVCRVCDLVSGPWGQAPSWVRAYFKKMVFSINIPKSMGVCEERKETYLVP